MPDPFRGGRTGLDPALEALDRRLQRLESQIKVLEAENKLKEQELKQAKLRTALQQALLAPLPEPAGGGKAATPLPSVRVLMVSLGAQPQALVEVNGARFLVRPGQRIGPLQVTEIVEAGVMAQDGREILMFPVSTTTGGGTTTQTAAGSAGPAASVLPPPPTPPTQTPSPAWPAAPEVQLPEGIPR